MRTPWDELHRAYFSGEALSTYLTTARPARAISGLDRDA
jgi:hypothetical protein